MTHEIQFGAYIQLTDHRYYSRVFQYPRVKNLLFTPSSPKKEYLYIGATGKMSYYLFFQFYRIYFAFMFGKRSNTNPLYPITFRSRHRLYQRKVSFSLTIDRGKIQ